MKPRQERFWTPSADECGLSRGAWASLAVKSLRLGWPTGLREASGRLDKPYMRLVLLCGTFEDIFPADAELAEVMAEIKGFEYEALCRRETHHLRGYTAQFCDMEKEAAAAVRNNVGWIYAQANKRRLWIPRRGLNTFYTWCKMAPGRPGIVRDVDPTPWAGMPKAMLDGHTPEGKAAGRRMTVISGHYENHRALAELLSTHGWEHVRHIVHSKERWGNDR